ncbi:MAG: HAD-IA family hydrolase [Firmicutes bacterium]|nr:HAD-IA family hydrolase [Bacillota bacterium]
MTEQSRKVPAEALELPPIERAALEGSDMKLHAIIYDFDLTLADSSRGVIECVNYALNCMGLPNAPADRVRETIGLSMSATFEYVTGQTPESALVTEFSEHFKIRADRVMADLTYLFPKVPDVVRLFYQKGIRQGIVSNKLRYRIEDITVRDRIRECFSAIIGAEDIIRHKPDPSGLRAAMEHLKCQPDATVYVGDHLVDAETAARAGVSFVGVLTGVTTPERFRRFPVRAIIESLTQLPEILGIESVGRGVSGSA